MTYTYAKQLRRAVPTDWLAAVKRRQSREDRSAGESKVASKSTSGRRLLTDGGETESDTEDDESDDSEGADEEMAPPEREGDAGVEEAEQEAEAEEEEPEEKSEEAEAEEEEPEAAEAEEEEPEAAEAEEEESDEEEAEEAEGTVDVPQSDVESVGATEDESTTVLFLDLYGLDLDLLGLEIELHQLVLDVFATEGDGNLLGNLLSAVAGLTDPGGLSNLLPDVSDMMPEGGLSGMLPGGDKIKSALGVGGGEEGEEGEQGEEGQGESGGLLSSAASKARGAVPSLPVKQLLIEVIAGVIRQLLESPDKEASGEDASGEGS